jgi:hypothetical protein
VLQHIPVRRGLELTRRLIELAAADGVVVLHALYRHPFLLRQRSRMAASVRSGLRRLWSRTPEMEMNPYPVNELLSLVQDAGGQSLHVELTDHGGCRGVILFFKKGPGRQPIA